MTAIASRPASLSVDPVGLRAVCYRYADRPPILTIHRGDQWSVTLAAAEAVDPQECARSAGELLRVATEYVEAVGEWTERRHVARICCPECGGQREAVTDAG